MSMKLKVVLLILISANLAACKVELTSAGNDDKDEGQVLTKSLEISGEAEIIDADTLYDFELTGTVNTLLLKGNLRRITVAGDRNNVTIVEDDYIERLAVNGDGNSFNIDSDDVIVDEIFIEGDNNILIFSQCHSITDTGADNQIMLLDGIQCEAAINK